MTRVLSIAEMALGGESSLLGGVGSEDFKTLNGDKVVQVDFWCPAAVSSSLELLTSKKVNKAVRMTSSSPFRSSISKLEICT